MVTLIIVHTHLIFFFMTTLFLLTTGRVVGLRLTHPDRQLVSGMIINEFNHFTPPVGGDLYM